MGLDELAGCMEVLKKRLQSHRAVLRENGTRTRMALIDTLLRRDGKPAAIVEAKSWARWGSHRMRSTTRMRPALASREHRCS
jgi:hypothetical protein